MRSHPPNPALDDGVKQSLRAVLRHAMALENGLEVTPLDRGNLDSRAFLSEVRRQRVEIFLSAHLSELGLPHDVSDQIRDWAAQLKMRAMSCAVATREAWAALDSAGIDALVIKGIALSLQTTGSITGRGPGDIDLWVRPSEVGSAVRALEAIGYRVSASSPTSEFTSWRGRFTQWAAFELQMERNGLPLDLHWQLAGARHGLPTFDNAWRGRVKVDIGGTQVCTLAPEDAFVHSCSHAHRDGWGWLRSLIDIDRLSRVTTIELSSGRSSRALSLSAAMAYDVTASPSLRPWISQDVSAVKRARRIALMKQSGSGWSVAQAWSLQSTWDWLHQYLQLAGDAGDVTRVLSGFALPPELLIDATSRQPVPLRRAIGARFGKMARRVSHQD